MDLRTLKGVLTRIIVALKGVFSFSGRLATQAKHVVVFPALNCRHLLVTDCRLQYNYAVSSEKYRFFLLLGLPNFGVWCFVAALVKGVEINIKHNIDFYFSVQFYCTSLLWGHIQSLNMF